MVIHDAWISMVQSDTNYGMWVAMVRVPRTIMDD